MLGEILGKMGRDRVYPDPTTYMLTSFGSSSFIRDVFHRLLLNAPQFA